MSSLVHLLREPAGAPDGALVLNHGRGADEHDLFGLLNELDPQRRLLGVTTGAPLTDVPPGGRHWYLVPRVGYPDHDTFHSSLDLLSGFCDGLLAERGIAWDRTAIGGFSMGAVMSYAVGLGAGRPRPGALLAFSGFVPTVEGWHVEPAGREDMAVLIHHGAADPIIPVEFGRAARDLLTGGGLRVDYLETDVGHALPAAAIERARALVAAVGDVAG